MMKLSTVGIDLAKRVFQLPGVDEAGRVVLRRQASRHQLLEALSRVEPCLIGMEACGSANHREWELKKRGHEVRLISPQFVKPYVKSNRNGAADAEAICEAVGRPSMRVVPTREVVHQDISSWSCGLIDGPSPGHGRSRRPITPPFAPIRRTGRLAASLTNPSLASISVEFGAVS